MSEQKVFRFVEKNRRTVLVDLDGNILQPHEALELAETVKAGVVTKSYVYIGIRESDLLVKIGLTDNPDRRKGEVGAQFVHLIECDAYGDYGPRPVETRLHEFFKEDRVEGEWFKLGATDVNLIRVNCKTARDTLPFLDAFDEAFHAIAQRITNEGLLPVAADLVDSRMKNMMTMKAAWYVVQKLPTWKGESADVEELMQIEGVISLVRQVFISRNEANQRMAAK